MSNEETVERKFIRGLGGGLARIQCILCRVNMIGIHSVFLSCFPFLRFGAGFPFEFF